MPEGWPKVNCPKCGYSAAERRPGGIQCPQCYKFYTDEEIKIMKNKKLAEQAR